MQFDHIALEVDSIEEGSIWYQKNMFAEIEYKDESWCLLKIGNAKVALVLKDMHPSHFAFKVDSKDKLGSINKHRDGSLYNYITDPWGNTAEFIYYPKEKN